MTFSTTDKAVNWTVCAASLMLAPLAPAILGIGALYYGIKAANRYVAKPTLVHLKKKHVERLDHDRQLKQEEIAEQGRQRHMFDLFMEQLQDVQVQLDHEQRQNTRLGLEMLYQTHVELHERVPKKVIHSIIRKNLSDEISPVIFRERADRIQSWLESVAVPSDSTDQPEALAGRIARDLAKHMELLSALKIIPNTEDYDVAEFREAEINRYRQSLRDQIEQSGGQGQ